MSALRRPLAGLRVLDLGNFLAGPVVSMHLGAMGADVIKVREQDSSRCPAPVPAFCSSADRAYVLESHP